MEAAKEIYTLDEVCLTLGLEKSRLRFMEKEFGTFFGFPGVSPYQTRYSRKQLVIRQKIDRLLDRPDLSVSQIKTQFHRLCLERGKGVWVIAVTSGKGGVGKTTLSVNLAVMLARHRFRTVLFDADLGLANAHVLLGIDPKRSVIDLLSGKAGIEEILAEGPSGVKLIPGGSGVYQLAEIDEACRESLVDELTRLRKMTDILVIDTAAGISKNVMKFLGLADEIIAVTTPNIAATLDAFGMMKVAIQQKAAGGMNLIVNRARDRSEAEKVYGKIAMCAREFLGHSVNSLGFVCEDLSVEQAIQERTPVVNLSPHAPSVRCVEAITGELVLKRKDWKGAKQSRLVDLFAPLEVL
jgi:flagellar biosynthesis protein FlhG